MCRLFPPWKKSIHRDRGNGFSGNRSVFRKRAGTIKGKLDRDGTRRTRRPFVFPVHLFVGNPGSFTFNNRAFNHRRGTRVACVRHPRDCRIHPYSSWERNPLVSSLPGCIFITESIL